MDTVEFERFAKNLLLNQKNKGKMEEQDLLKIAFTRYNTAIESEVCRLEYRTLYFIKAKLCDKDLDDVQKLRGGAFYRQVLYSPEYKAHWDGRFRDKDVFHIDLTTGNTSLHEAAERIRTNTKCVPVHVLDQYSELFYLLKRGLQKTTTNHEGLTAYDLIKNIPTSENLRTHSDCWNAHFKALLKPSDHS